MTNQNINISFIERKIGYGFKNKDLLIQAFTRSSYANEYGIESNETLEFLGDSVLSYYTIKILSDKCGYMNSERENYDSDTDYNSYKLKGGKDESYLTTLTETIVSNENLSKRIDILELSEYLLLGKTDIENNINTVTKVKADLFEAILGAIAIDSEWDKDELENAVSFMLNLDDLEIETDKEETDLGEITQENAVTKLKELSEHGVCSTAEYTFNQELGSESRSYWYAKCSVRSWGLETEAVALKKSDAKAKAAYYMLTMKYQK